MLFKADLTYYRGMLLERIQNKMMGMLMSGLTLTSMLKASGTENEFVSRLQGYYAKNITTEQQMGKRQEMIPHPQPPPPGGGGFCFFYHPIILKSPESAETGD